MKNDLFLCTSEKYISHPYIGVNFVYVRLGIPMRCFAMKTILFQSFWSYPENSHKKDYMYYFFIWSFSFVENSKFEIMQNNKV